MKEKIASAIKKLENYADSDDTRANAAKHRGMFENSFSEKEMKFYAKKNDLLKEHLETAQKLAKEYTRAGKLSDETQKSLNSTKLTREVTELTVYIVADKAQKLSEEENRILVKNLVRSSLSRYSEEG